MQLSILSGIYSDGAAQLRTSMPRNLVPVPNVSGVSNGYLGPAPGVRVFASGPGIGRGGINWGGDYYRVMGERLVLINSSGITQNLGSIGAGGVASFDYSFDRLAIASGGRLYYYKDGLTPVTDQDIGFVVDVIWIDGYFMMTDGISIIVTELNDPTSVNPLKYGSSEADPDPVVALKKVHGEAAALNRYTIEFFQNVGGDLFPFQRVDGARINRGCVGTHACTNFMDSIAFLGSGRNEPPAVWFATSGSSQKLSTREVDTVLLGYTEEQLSTVVVEAKLDRSHQHLMVHLPDRTLVFDAAATAALEEPVWFELGSGIAGHEQYRQRNLVWAYGAWHCEDPQSPVAGLLVDDVATQYGAAIGWDFGTSIVYNEGRGAIIHGMELACLPGRTPLGNDPVVWTSYSLDGVTWSQEHPTSAGKTGELLKRLTWRRCGHMRNMRMQRFRGTSDALASFLRLELAVEPLNG